MCRKTSEDSVRACLQDVPSCALYAVFGIFPKSRYRQTCWVNSIQSFCINERVFVREGEGKVERQSNYTNESAFEPSDKLGSMFNVARFLQPSTAAMRR